MMMVISRLERTKKKEDINHKQEITISRKKEITITTMVMMEMHHLRRTFLRRNIKIEEYI